MPTYEYECQSCNKTFELFQSITDKPVRRCPTCGTRKVRRLISAGGGFLFRGSGFYQTDYRSEKYKAEAKADSGTSTPSSSDSSTKDSGTKDSGSKDSGTKDSGTKDSGSKDSGSKHGPKPKK
jgi:putative FmdB family regulatory protein